MEEWMYLAGLLVLAAVAVGVVVPVITLVMVRRLRDQVGWLDDQQQERHRAMQRQLTEIRQQLGPAAPSSPAPATRWRASRRQSQRKSSITPWP